jgi:hypothetical protein
MRKTNEELDTLIGDQTALLPQAAELVDVQRGHVSRSLGQTARNRATVIQTLEAQKEAATVNIKAGI